MKIIENELTSQVEETIIGLLDTCQNFLDEEKVKKSNYFSIKYFYNVDVLNTQVPILMSQVDGQWHTVKSRKT